MRNKTLYLLPLLLLAPLVQACGPWLPEAYVLRNDELFYAPPKVGFGAELRHLMPQSVPHAAQLDAAALGSESSQEELRVALAAAGTAEAEIDLVVNGYTQFRTQLNSIKPYLERAPFVYYAPAMDEDLRQAKLEELSELQVPAGLPAEFTYYLEGALAYYRDDHAGALRNWKAVLALPEDARHYRSVMAAFMIGKACPESALLYFSAVRGLVEEGYADSQGLAAASYGREAKAYLERGQHQSAIHLYLQQWASGYGNAEQSLYRVARDVWRYDFGSRIAALVADEQSRAVLTAYLLTQSEHDDLQRRRDRFLELLPDPKTLTVAEAGRFALMEYQHNNLTSARLWIGYAAPEDALALWVQSKLLLRAGKIEEGRTLMMALTVEMAEKGEDWRRLDTSRAWGELGVLLLSDKRYVDAADAFWNSGSWEDCAYVLERLLSIDELIAWCDAHPIDTSVERGTYYEVPQALLARRLMREARFEEALSYFEPELRSHAETYLQAMRAASDSSQDSVTRAQHYWTAARTMRDYGMQLVGAELTPDFAWMDGAYDWGDIAYQRRRNLYTLKYQLNDPTWEELKQAEQTQVLPDKRYHYRYRAVQLAELAAGLLPNNHEQAANIYCVAGDWIKLADPASADRLYKQLVVRCPETKLGQAAAAVNWFPTVDLDSIEPFAEAL